MCSQILLLPIVSRICSSRLLSLRHDDIPASCLLVHVHYLIAPTGRTGSSKYTVRTKAAQHSKRRNTAYCEWCVGGVVGHPTRYFCPSTTVSSSNLWCAGFISALLTKQEEEFVPNNPNSIYPDLLTTGGPIQFRSREGNLTIKLPIFLEIGGAI